MSNGAEKSLANEPAEEKEEASALRLQTKTNQSEERGVQLDNFLTHDPKTPTSKHNVG